MNARLPQRLTEIESKFSVADDFVVPSLDHVLSSELHAIARPDMTLTAQYVDTADLRLLSWGVTLRRREGGSDAGWHLKVPAAKGRGRHEFHEPLSDEIPATLAGAVVSLTGGEDLVPLATVTTKRHPTLIQRDSSSDAAVMELVDDRVTINRPNTNDVEFRELEVELLDEQELRLWKRVGEHLVDHGAQPTTLKKIARLLHGSSIPKAALPESPKLSKKSSLGDVFRAFFSDNTRRMVLSDVGVHLDAEDAVHQMRVSARQMRSALRLFADFLETEWASELDGELKWIANELGANRDSEVQSERLIQHCLVLPPDLHARAQAVIQAEFADRMASSRGSALAAVRSDRYRYLVEDLRTAIDSPRFAVDPETSARSALAKPLQKTWRKLAKGFSEIELDSPSEQWHDLRITAKRARYAVDLVQQITDVSTLAQRMAMLTDVLGDHQDAHVSGQLLRGMADDSKDGPTGFALGVLATHERDFELLDRIRAFDLWNDLRKTASSTKMLTT